MRAEMGGWTAWPTTLVAASLNFLGCGEPEEPARVELEVFADPSQWHVVENDLGYRIELIEARLILEDLSFSGAGELHASTRPFRHLFVSQARAHPGHHQGGTVTGELPGRYLVDWRPDAVVLGIATFLAGTYTSANFRFGRADADDGIAMDDPLWGHTAILRGHATRDGAGFEFLFRLDAPDGRELIGAPFEQQIGPDANHRLGLQLLLHDPLGEQMLFDGIDFEALDASNENAVVVDSISEGAAAQAYHVVRRRFLSHDHFTVHAHPASADVGERLP